MTVVKKVQLHIVDSSSGAAQRWTRRLASTVDASVRIWDAVPARIPSKGPIVWVLVPDSFASPLAQEDVLDVARRADLRDSVLVVCADDSRLLWDDRATVMLEQEPDHAFTRTLGLLVRMARDQHALHAALQFPVENPNPVMQFSADGHLMYSNPAATEVMALLRMVLRLSRSLRDGFANPPRTCMWLMWDGKPLGLGSNEMRLME